MAQPAFLSSLRSRLRSPQPQPPTPHLQPRRGFHVELGAREKALLEEDTALKRFKSYKNSVKQVSKVGNVLTLVVVAAPGMVITVERGVGGGSRLEIDTGGGSRLEIDSSGGSRLEIDAGGRSRLEIDTGGGSRPKIGVNGRSRPKIDINGGSRLGE